MNKGLRPCPLLKLYGEDMYKLTLEISSHAELIALVMKLGPSAIKADLKVTEVSTPAIPEEETVTTEVINDAPAPKKAAVRNRAPKAAEKKEEMIEVESPFVAPVSFNRDLAIARATELVGKLKASGIKDTEVMPHIHEVYKQAGCDLTLRIGQFEDADLQRFLPLFEQKVSDIVVPEKPKSTAQSFI